MLKTTVCLALLLAAGTTMPAQEAPGAAESRHMDRHIIPGLGLRVGTPQKASIALGVVAGIEGSVGQRDFSRNMAVFVEPGLGAGRASVAYLAGFSDLGSGIGLSATVMRTWANPWSLDANTTYAGAEVFIWPVFLIGPRVGVFRRITGNTGSRPWVVAVDFGFGL